jgi:hypothetical protein
MMTLDEAWNWYVATQKQRLKRFLERFTQPILDDD